MSSNKSNIDWDALSFIIFFVALFGSCATCSVVEEQERTNRKSMEVQKLEKQIELEKLRQGR